LHFPDSVPLFPLFSASSFTDNPQLPEKPMRSILAYLLVIYASALATAAHEPLSPAAIASPKSSQPAAPADPKIKALKTVAIQRPAQGASREEAGQLRRAEAEVWLAQAEKLRAYRGDETVTIDNAKEARHLEYVALLNAERAGNEFRKDARAALLQEIRTDRTLPGAQRCEAVGHSKYLELHNQWRKTSRELANALVESATLTGKAKSVEELLIPAVDAKALAVFKTSRSRDKRLAAYAEIERSLIDEFPDAVNGYEGLLNIACDSPESEGMPMVQELLRMENIPAEIKTKAAFMQARYDLLGRMLSEIAPGMGLTAGKEMWIYSWAQESDGSRALGEHLNEMKPGNVELVAFCLDAPNAGNTLENAVKEFPPGRLIHDDGVMGTDLVMNEPGLVYAISAEGKIRTINVLNERHRNHDGGGTGGPVQ
jgi:hypothetical protein